MSEEKFYQINKEITSKLGRAMFSRPYLAIIDASGKIRYIDEALNEYRAYIIEFTRKNFTLLEKGDHSIPLGGVNLAFFKPANNFLIIIHSKKGPIGQLLSFKKMMPEFADEIKSLIGDVKPIKPKIIESKKKEKKKEEKKEKKVKKVKAPKAQRLPFLVKKLKGKFKIDTSRILELCDGKHSITDIVRETSFPKLKVEMTLKKYKKKGWVKYKRVII
ncbi:MAG: hypothetical protein GF329_08575 [Candidatus Lokiarchaeota archaeon]|nr:hypothetical protein [Candidatus Lokiarchaeota archaeon]